MMKKILFVTALIMGMAFVSCCGNQTETSTETATDSVTNTATETPVIDTLNVA